MKSAGDQPLRIDLSNLPNNPDNESIFRKLWSFSEEKGGPSQREPLTISVRDSQGVVVGGISGRTSWGWLFIEDFWLPNDLRGQGIGHDLLSGAEREAIRRGCHSAWLDTFTFHSAQDFYASHGYETFGQLKDFPRGHDRIFMQKRLIPTE